MLGQFLEEMNQYSHDIESHFFECQMEYIKENAKPNDIVLTLGAGDVTDIGPMILNNK